MYTGNLCLWGDSVRGLCQVSCSWVSVGGGSCATCDVFVIWRVSRCAHKKCACMRRFCEVSVWGQVSLWQIVFVDVGVVCDVWRVDYRLIFDIRFPVLNEMFVTLISFRGFSKSFWDLTGKSTILVQSVLLWISQPDFQNQSTVLNPQRRIPPPGTHK